MKPCTILFTFFFLLFSGTADAKRFEATIIDLEGNTIKCEIRASVKVFDSVIEESTVYRTIRVVLPDGSKVKYRAGEIQQFTIHETAKIARVFESHTIKKGKQVFLEVIGKTGIPLYHHYYLGAGLRTYFCYAVEDPEGKIVLLKALKWRKHLTEIYPGSAYFERELKERDYKLYELPAFLSGYGGASARRE